MLIGHEKRANDEARHAHRELAIEAVRVLTELFLIVGGYIPAPPFPEGLPEAPE